MTRPPVPPPHTAVPPTMRPPGGGGEVATGGGLAARPGVWPASASIGVAGSDPGGWAVAPVARGSLALFLALYLLLLAFFIMLNALSSLENQRASAVMDSLTTTFRAAPAPAPASGVVPLDAVPGPGLAAEAFTAVLRDLFEATIPAARIERLAPGQALTLSLRADTLFESGADRLRPARLALFDAIIAALAQAPAGMRFEMTALLYGGTASFDPDAAGAGADAGAGRPEAGDALAFRRATALARLMGTRGAEPGTVVTGLIPGDERRIRLSFTVLDAGRGRPDLSGATPLADTSTGASGGTSGGDLNRSDQP